MVAGKGSGYGNLVPVLKENNYDLESGEKSVFEQVYSRASTQSPEHRAHTHTDTHTHTQELKGRTKAQLYERKKPQRAGVDYENEDVCIQCMDGGDCLVCCDRCPVSVHPRCIGMHHSEERRLTNANAPLLSGGQFTCPHHHCSS